MRIGIDLGGTKIEVRALSDAGAELANLRRPTPAGDYEGTVAAIAGLVADVEADLGPAESIGIGTPGAIDPVTGLLKNSNSTALNGKPLDVDVAAALDRDIRMANDADCFAVSEAMDGAGAGASSVFGVILGTGVGGGIVANGRLVGGPNRIAGEWGHNALPWPRPDESPGPQCYCGLSGCIETFLSGPSLAADHRRRGGADIEAAQVAGSADHGDPLAQETMAAYHDRLARGLAGVINILDPEVIVLGGGVSNIKSIYSVVPRLWGEYVFSSQVLTRLMPAVHGDSSGVRGAAWLWNV
jgi:fructokinase